MFGVFFFLTQFLQRVMGFSPLRAGVAFLPLTAALFVMSRTAPRLMPRLGAKPAHGHRDAAGHHLAGLAVARLARD